MTTVYLLWHSSDRGDDQDDAKLIGVYSTRTAAEAAQARALVLKGFRDAPEGFEIDGYELDRDHWEEGFVTARY